ncbi:bifunctional (p)ppGpp synthetase/guanosine-3',5'-bis(diphosphate) 3'-pyrophosphohydrolase [Candidatus Saccharibacteria bacterium]|nr:bifunctional (p)ppGpp synthetase/guanosine-3',5'-bis(diphosphate) 3'-pyrophosphohydrolase [Candidatus Saccharibacteria bacterium]
MSGADREISKTELLEVMGGRLDRGDLDLIGRAYDFGAACHEGQLRASGASYFEGHCAHVALHLYQLEMSPAVIIAGLLHESLRKTDTGPDALERRFGQEVAFLVAKVSELGELKYQHYRRHVTSLRKFFATVAQDARVIVIKLCDRYHNLQTLEHIPEEKRLRIAEESMLIHANFAQKLNLTQLQQQINDAALPYVLPEDWRRVKALQKAFLAKANKLVETIYRQCAAGLSKELGYTPAIDRRVKSTYSLYKKLKAKNWDIDAIYDIVALRVIVRDMKDCYQALGIIHARWQPLDSRFKDYIASPKPNGYQSLHTTIFSGDGLAVEIQIKTPSMHRNAEFGPASHLGYKGGQDKLLDREGAVKNQFDWLEQLELPEGGGDADEELKRLKTDLFEGHIFVKTPQGDVIDLPEGSTVLDFAFAVHTDLGLTARGGLVNGVYRALKTPLKAHDTVEIVTDRKVSPQSNWLDWVKTPNAKQRIRNNLARRDR